MCSQNLPFENLRQKIGKKSLKSKQKNIVKKCKIHVKWSKLMTFLVWVYTSQNVAQTHQNFVQAHAGMTAILRISVKKKNSADLKQQRYF